MKYLLLSIMLIVAALPTAAISDYDYPFDDALVATVLGTPDEYTADLPKDIYRKEMTVIVHPDRPITNLSPTGKLNYALVTQKNKKAPLVFSIAGTGGSHRGSKMLLMEQVLAKAGFHVVSLSSPTYANFIITASRSHIPGHLKYDSEDLYFTMQRIWDQVKSKVEVSEFYVTGYSLGGAQAAFVAKIDEEKKVFNFKKVLMINPPVSLYNSVDILDHMLINNLDTDVQSVNRFFDEMMTRFTEVYTRDQSVDFNDEFLYKVYQDRTKEPDPKKLEALIGLSFRISAANLITAMDFLTNSGYILPKNHQWSKTETTTPYFKVAVRTTFVDYINDRAYPYFASNQPGLTLEQLKQQTSLHTITDYLRSAEHIAVMHNEDDVILQQGEIDYFRDVFQSRAQIYPKGGHCGNMAYRDNVAHVIDYFTK